MQKSQIAPAGGALRQIPSGRAWRTHQHALQRADHGMAVEKRSCRGRRRDRGHGCVLRINALWNLLACHCLKQCAKATLEFDVCAERRYDHRAAIAVIAGIVDMLHAGSNVYTAPNVCRVVSLENILAAVIQLAIAQQETLSSRRQVVLMIFHDGIAHKSYARAVLLAMPPCAVRAHAFGKG